MWTRRAFMASAGAAFVAGLGMRNADALAGSELVFASAGRMGDGSFAAAIVSEQGDLISTLRLPARGHEVTQNPVNGQLVVFAWRPGTFAVVFTPEGAGVKTITSPEGRHFFGHGVFSSDGKLLYATENDFENSQGVIGIYDASDGFRRIGEFSSGGMGPHDLLISPDGKMLCIANGGIETHPDYGRTKLNLATMEPNLSWVDRDSGALIARHELPSDLHKLSLRHLAMGENGRVWVGGQFQGERNNRVPLLASASPGDDFAFAPLPEAMNARLAGYIGSLVSSPDGQQIMATSPVGNVAVFLDLPSGKSSLVEAQNVCGNSWNGDGFTYSTGDGAFHSGDIHKANAGILFDHHLVALGR